MREILAIKEFYKAYTKLSLKRSKIIGAIFMMLTASVLEMIGLSILYPLTMLLTGTKKVGNHDFLTGCLSNSSPQKSVGILFAGILIFYTAKNVALYFTYNNNIQFAVYCHVNFIKGLYRSFITSNVLDLRSKASGEYANIICVQAEKVVHGILRPFMVIITELFLLVGIVGLLLSINPLLIMTVVFFCILVGVIFYICSRNKAFAWGKKRMDALAVLLDLVNNTSRGINDIKIYGKESYILSKVNEATSTETDMFHKLEMYQQAPRFLMETTFIITTTLYFIILLLHGAIPSVVFAQFSILAAASFRIMPSMNRIVNSYSYFVFNVGPALSVLNELKNVDVSADADQITKKSKVNKQLDIQIIEFKNITFSYPLNNIIILDNVNFKLQGGRRIGIFGKSGSGKSTVIEILAGLYSPCDGHVLVNGTNIFNDLWSWQSIVGYVPQTPFIMPASIRENITFGGTKSVNDSDIWSVLKIIEFDEYVSALPSGLDEPIGEKGVLLSGGQKQLICIARALYRDAKILLLDEPTAALDPGSEAMVMNAINNLPKNKTVVMVSHKMHNFSKFDVIYLCVNSQMIEHKKRGIFFSDIEKPHVNTPI